MGPSSADPASDQEPAGGAPPAWPLPEDRLERNLADHAPLMSEGEVLAEANRCLFCVDAPCVTACPTRIDVPGFIRKITTGNLRGAARTILEANVLGWSCSRACPVEVLCEGACVHRAWSHAPIAIGRLQRYATEPFIARGWHPRPAGRPTGRRVALVGCGPASLAAAAQLVTDGHAATIFERRALPGGLTTTGVATYKVPATDALREAAWVRSLGVEFRLSTPVIATSTDPADWTAARLLREFDAVFLGVGLGPDSRLGVPGEDGTGVIGATALIERIKTGRGPDLSLVRRATVVGGGNTAVDAVRQLKQLGVAQVAMVCRRPARDLAAFAHEVSAARAEGVVILDARQTLRIARSPDAGGGRVIALIAMHTPPGREPAPAETIDTDLVVVAVGQDRSAADLARAFGGVTFDGRGRIVVNAEFRTGNPRVWAAGDAVNGGQEVVNAVAEAMVAARSLSAALGGVARG